MNGIRRGWRIHSLPLESLEWVFISNSIFISFGLEPCSSEPYGWCSLLTSISWGAILPPTWTPRAANYVRVVVKLHALLLLDATCHYHTFWLIVGKPRARMVQINAGTPQRHPQRRQGEVNDAMNPNSNKKTENPSKHITLDGGRSLQLHPASGGSMHTAPATRSGSPRPMPAWEGWIPAGLCFGKNHEIEWNSKIDRRPGYTSMFKYPSLWQKAKLRRLSDGFLKTPWLSLLSWMQA